MSEPLTDEIHVSITPNDGNRISLQQRILGMNPFVLLSLNPDTEQFEIEAGGGVKDLEELKLVIGYIAQALGYDVSDGSADEATA